MLKTCPRTAVLIHGYTLKALHENNTRNWLHVLFGDNDNHGRVPVGLRIAQEFSADLIIIGTGANCFVKDSIFSRKEFDELPCTKKPEVIWEAEFIWATALNEKNCFGLLPTTEPILETLSANTSEEIRNTLAICARENITRLFLVTSPSHLPRCVREANKYRLPIIDVFGVACNTDFADNNEETFIAEPYSGSGKKPELSPNQFFPKIYEVHKKYMPELIRALHEVINDYKRLSEE